MAAKTPDSRTTHSLGSERLIRLVYSATTIDDADTYASGIVGIVDHWFNQTDDPTAQAAAGMTISESAGTFTFHPGENGALGTLYVMAKQ